MSDYSKIVNFTAKDALTTGDPAKLAKGTELDAELDAISVAIATKYDNNDIASEPEAETLTSNAKLLTPLRLDNVFKDNLGLLNTLHEYADPGADRLFGWDDSATDMIGFSLGNGLETSTTSIQLSSSLAGDLLDYSAGVLSLTDVAAGADNPMNLSGTTWTFDITALGAATMPDLGATDTIVVDDGGTAKKIELQEMGMRVQTGQTTQPLTAADMNTIMEFDTVANPDVLTLPLNASTALPIGVPIVLCVNHATQTLTVTAAASVTLNSVNHPGGTAAASDTVDAGGTALLYKTAADEWYLSGDITD